MDLSDEAFQAAKKGYFKMMNGLKVAKQMAYGERLEEIDEKQAKQVEGIIDSIYRGMNDDFNTAVAIAGLFNLLKKINSIHTNQLSPQALGKALFEKATQTYITFVEEILGLIEEKPQQFEHLVEMVLEEYKEAKAQKAYGKVDKLRAGLKEVGITVKDMKDKIDWAYDEA